MKKASFFVDIHCHPTFKSANSGYPKPLYNIWEDFDHVDPSFSTTRYLSRNSMEVAKYSQTNFDKLSKGKVRVVFNALYPIEKGFINLRNIPNALTRKKVQHEMFALLTGMGPDKIAKFQKSNDYLKDLEEEYDYLKLNQGKSPNGEWRHEIAKDYDHLKSILKQKKTIASIITVEGAHVFFNKKMLSAKLNKTELKAELKKNIELVKEWEHPPFMVNLAHHFYNQLTGHAKSFFKIEVSEGLLNQKKGLNVGLQGLGIKALKEMLSNRNGKRIHVDTKHMSLQSRKELYNWISSYNYLNKNDMIPIISSHTGVNGYKSMFGSVRQADSIAKKKGGYFFNWSINVSDEEINIIHESKGIMGIMIDKTKLGGGKFFASLAKIKDEQKIKDAYLKLIWDNIFQVINAVGEKTAWDIIALGTDYDGAISHVHPYDSSEKIPALYDDLKNYLEEHNYEKKMWFGYEPVELLNKIFQKNAMDFCKRYFV